jgi:hypothetical protein
MDVLKLPTFVVLVLLVCVRLNLRNKEGAVLEREQLVEYKDLIISVWKIGLESDNVFGDYIMRWCTREMERIFVVENCRVESLHIFNK